MPNIKVSLLVNLPSSWNQSVSSTIRKVQKAKIKTRASTLCDSRDERLCWSQPTRWWKKRRKEDTKICSEQLRAKAEHFESIYRGWICNTRKSSTSHKNKVTSMEKMMDCWMLGETGECTWRFYIREINDVDGDGGWKWITWRSVAWRQSRSFFIGIVNLRPRSGEKERQRWCRVKRSLMLRSVVQRLNWAGEIDRDFSANDVGCQKCWGWGYSHRMYECKNVSEGEWSYLEICELPSIWFDKGRRGE